MRGSLIISRPQPMQGEHQFKCYKNTYLSALLIKMPLNTGKKVFQPFLKLGKMRRFLAQVLDLMRFEWYFKRNALFLFRIRLFRNFAVES